MITVDRIEGDIIVLLDGDEKIDAGISLFDGEVREGDVVERLPDGRFRADTSETERRRREITELQNSLWN